MAAPASVPRRTRTHGVAAPRPRGRGVVAPTRGTAAVAPARPARARQRPEPIEPDRRHLRVVAPRRRRAIGLAVAGFTMLFGLMLGATALQARLAQTQLELDSLDRDLADAKETYDLLRRQRAELLAPERLAAEAKALGMAPGENTEFVSVPPEIVAQVAVAASGVDAEIGIQSATPLEEFADVKAVAGGAP